MLLRWKFSYFERERRLLWRCRLGLGEEEEEEEEEDEERELDELEELEPLEEPELEPELLLELDLNESRFYVCKCTAKHSAYRSSKIFCIRCPNAEWQYDNSLWPAAATGSTVSSASFLSASGLVSPLFCASRLLFSPYFILLLFFLLRWGGRPVEQVMKAKLKNFSVSMLQANCLGSR